ncbi:MAG: recombination protein NinB [Bacteroidales bacterium]|jgi:hypothetical protein|nr:recombination protein NinB [Bacteroidales bacterium]
MLLKILIPSDKAKIIDYITKLADSKKYLVEIKVKREKRTIDQNALYWLWLSCIMSETGNDRDTLHEFFKSRFLEADNVTVRMLDVLYNVAIPRSTAKLDTKEMTGYLNRIQQFANTDLGIALPTLEDLYWEEFYHQYKNFI